MHRLRCLLAVMFAILIASPACCCLGSPSNQVAESTSCCGGEPESDHEVACQCSSQVAAAVENDNILPASHAQDLPRVLPTSLPQLTPSAPEIVSHFSPEIDTGPPRRLFALFQRFLI